MRINSRPLLSAFLAVGALAAIAAGSTGAGSSAARGSATSIAHPPQSFIVRAAPGTEQRVAHRITDLGGTVGTRLAVINGFEAKLPAGAAGTVRGLEGVVSVTANAKARPMAATGYTPTSDVGSMYRTTVMTGARAFWRAGYTGKGIDVAVIDSGAAPVEGLNTPDKVVDGPDLSFESQAPELRYLDTFGHGTHMSGIIAGRATDAVAPYASDTTNFLGMAPDARIVSLKVADARGGTDVSQVIAAIDWVVQNRNAPGLNIRVLNLSYGTDSAQSYEVDPLAYAVEVAWQSGIVVVASTGNDGYVAKSGSLTLPATDPHILAVGASNPQGTDSLLDDTVADFSSTGSKARKPDLVAPGKSIVSLRVPGSFADQNFASTGAVTDTMFRGSGTSQAAAVVSGAAALLLQRQPGLTPADVKRLLAGSATPLPKVKSELQGAGSLDLQRVLTKPKHGPAVKARFSTGRGSLHESRGTKRLVLDGVVLTGELDIFGNVVSTAELAALQATRSSWSNGSWNRSSWSGDGWTRSSWSNGKWSRSSWSAGAWTRSSWSNGKWSRSSWSNGKWDGGAWSGGTWSGSDWSGGTWNASVWDAGAWD